MQKRFPLNLALVALFAFTAISMYGQDELTQDGHGRPEPPMGGVHWVKGYNPGNKARPTSSPQLVYHGGPVAHGVTAEPIFWGSSWSEGDQKIADMDIFYQGVGSSTYAGTNTEYTDSNGHVSAAVSFGGHHVDSTSTNANGQRTQQILDEVCKVMGSNVKSGGYYPVYVDKPRGGAQFCAWHSAGSCGSVAITFAFFFNLDGDAGCDPQDSNTGHSQGVAALGNVSGHELSEMLTDPQLNAWYDSGGAENADKCAWTFGTNFVTFKNGSDWKIQGNWSNAAFASSTGYANSKGQKGCLDGGNYK
jgi:hypothetical protein